MVLFRLPRVAPPLASKCRSLFGLGAGISAVAAVSHHYRYAQAATCTPTAAAQSATPNPGAAQHDLGSSQLDAAREAADEAALLETARHTVTSISKSRGLSLLDAILGAAGTRLSTASFPDEWNGQSTYADPATPFACGHLNPLKPERGVVDEQRCMHALGCTNKLDANGIARLVCLAEGALESKSEQAIQCKLEGSANSGSCGCSRRNADGARCAGAPALPFHPPGSKASTALRDARTMDIFKQAYLVDAARRLQALRSASALQAAPASADEPAAELKLSQRANPYAGPHIQHLLKAEWELANAGGLLVPIVVYPSAFTRAFKGSAMDFVRQMHYNAKAYVLPSHHPLFFDPALELCSCGGAGRKGCCPERCVSALKKLVEEMLRRGKTDELAYQGLPRLAASLFPQQTRSALQALVEGSALKEEAGPADAHEPNTLVGSIATGADLLAAARNMGFELVQPAELEELRELRAQLSDLKTRLAHAESESLARDVMLRSVALRASTTTPFASRVMELPMPSRKRPLIEQKQLPSDVDCELARRVIEHFSAKVYSPVAAASPAEPMHAAFGSDMLRPIASRTSAASTARRGQPTANKLGMSSRASVASSL